MCSFKPKNFGGWRPRVAGKNAYRLMFVLACLITGWILANPLSQPGLKTSQSLQAQESLAPDQLHVVFNVFKNGGKTKAQQAAMIDFLSLSRFSDPFSKKEMEGVVDLLRSGDVINIVTGNARGEADPQWVYEQISLLQDRLKGKDIAIWITTTGNGEAGNIQKLLDYFEAHPAELRRISSSVEAIGYDYEPNWPNCPECDENFQLSRENIAIAAERVKAFNERVGISNWKLVSVPTGKPLQEYIPTDPAFEFGWLYPDLQQASEQAINEFMIIQTQRYCRRLCSADGSCPNRYENPNLSTFDFRSVRDELYKQLLRTDKWAERDKFALQITVDSRRDSENGVPYSYATQCARQMAWRGFSRLSLWWAWPEREEMRAFLTDPKGLNRAPILLSEDVPGEQSSTPY
ncbi:MAG: hypothetical protein KC422_10675 [Trueperaceae bacterium]|nr:hypothetical protein [Trueperaceae bacterium]